MMIEVVQTFLRDTIKNIRIARRRDGNRVKKDNPACSVKRVLKERVTRQPSRHITLCPDEFSPGSLLTLLVQHPPLLPLLASKICFRLILTSRRLPIFPIEAARRVFAPRLHKFLSRPKTNRVELIHSLFRASEKKNGRGESVQSAFSFRLSNGRPSLDFSLENDLSSSRDLCCWIFERRMKTPSFGSVRQEEFRRTKSSLKLFT